MLEVGASGPVGNYIERQECKRFSHGVLAWVVCAVCVCQTPSGSSPGGVGVEGVKSASLVRHAGDSYEDCVYPGLRRAGVLEKRVFQFMRKTFARLSSFQSHNVKTYSFGATDAAVISHSIQIVRKLTRR